LDNRDQSRVTLETRRTIIGRTIIVV